MKEWKGENERGFLRPFKGGKGDFGQERRVGFGRKLGRKGLFLRHRRPLKPLCWSFSVLVGDYQGKGVRRPQKAGTETRPKEFQRCGDRGEAHGTEAEGMTEAQSYGKVAKLSESRSKNRVRILVGLLQRWRKGRKQRGFQSSKSKEVTKW